LGFSQQAERLLNKGGGRPGILRRATDFAWPEAGIQRGFNVIIKFDVFPPGFRARQTEIQNTPVVFTPTKKRR
jgi:hypothetical protein